MLAWNIWLSNFLAGANGIVPVVIVSVKYQIVNFISQLINVEPTIQDYDGKYSFTNVTKTNRLDVLRIFEKNLIIFSKTSSLTVFTDFQRFLLVAIKYIGHLMANSSIGYIGLQPFGSTNDYFGIGWYWLPTTFSQNFTILV